MRQLVARVLHCALLGAALAFGTPAVAAAPRADVDSDAARARAVKRIHERTERVSAHRAQWLREHGATSEDLDVLLLAANGRDRGNALARMLDLHPDEALVRHHVAAWCTLGLDPGRRPCDRYDAIRAYADAEPRNAWPWLMWAARAKERGDLVDAWWAIEKAAGASYATVHYRESARAVRDFLRRTQLDETPYEQGIALFGRVLALALPRLQDAVAVCGAGEAALALDAKQHALCHRVGELLAASDTFLEAGLGLRLLESHAATRAQREAAAELRSEQDALRSINELMPVDPWQPTAEESAAFVAYVDDFLEHGEVEASRRMIRREGYTLDAWRMASKRVAPVRFDN